MKKTFLILIVLIGFGTILSSCKKEDKVTFTISDASDISDNSATFHVSIEANCTITDRGICYSSQSNTPTTENSKVSAGNGIGGFYVMLIDLIENTVYYARPYAVANGVTYYGDIKMFKMLQNIYELTFSISDAFDISHNSATFNASASANTTITDRGVCYSSQINTPTTANSKISAGSGTGTFGAILIDLIESTVYYVRPYAVANGTVYYGEVKNFKTGLFINELTLTISEATNISHNSATFHSSVSANTTITDKGVCYSSQNNIPTIEDIKITFGGGTGSFSVTLNNLIKNTVYYVRLYAIANGTVYYGEVKNFKTWLFIDENVLINGVRWATRNVDMPGTFTAKPEDAGMFYQWNRNIGWSSTNPLINSNGGTTWDSSNPSGTEWERGNDPCPPCYRVPTRAEIATLLNTSYVTSSWTTENGVYGRRFTDKATNNSIFLPAAGNRDYSNGTLGGGGGSYWSSTMFSTSNPQYLFFNDNNAGHQYNGIRLSGFSVRPVAE